MDVEPRTSPESRERDLLGQIQKQMESGVEGYDPMSLMQPFLQQSGLPQGLTQGLSQGLASFGTYQQMMLDMLRQAGAGAAQQSGKGDQAAGEAGSEKPAASRGGRKSAASVRSRAKRDA